MLEPISTESNLVNANRRISQPRKKERSKMTASSKSQYNETDAFYMRGDLLRSAFGKWDVCDPVAHCILDLVEAQHELRDLFADSAENGIGSEAAFTAAVRKRHVAGERLMEALNDRDSWPDPELGQIINKK
jgi:hypothetical protein